MWRDSYDQTGPGVEIDDFRHPANDVRYRDIPTEVLPSVESIKCTVERVMPFWHNVICPQVMDNKRVIIVCHKNTLRSIFKVLQGLGEEDVKRYQIPNALPVVLEFDEDMKYLNNYCLMDQQVHTVKKNNPEYSHNNIDWTLM